LFQDYHLASLTFSHSKAAKFFLLLFHIVWLAGVEQILYTLWQAGEGTPMIYQGVTVVPKILTQQAAHFLLLFRTVGLAGVE
jgi:hypothetical protein